MNLFLSVYLCLNAADSWRSGHITEIGRIIGAVPNSWCA
jgi:hypothetical protein